MLVRSQIKEKDMCLLTLVNRDCAIDIDKDTEIDTEDRAEANKRQRENSFQFSVRIPSKTLRYMKM